VIQNLQTWLENNPTVSNLLSILGVLLLVVLSFWIAYRLLARGLIYLAIQTETQYDDIIVNRIKPRRMAIAAPLLVIYFYAYLVPDAQEFIQALMLFLLLWVAVFTVNGLLDAANDIYELHRGSTGLAIRGYLDIIKIFNLLVGIILSISIFTGRSPVALLAGLGAVTAVLLLIFRDTILSFVASVQISANDLVIEGDWLEVPEFNADGEVIDITLHQIKIQNWDKTISVVPTYKLMETSYKNWRGMSESGGRRIKRAVYLDLHSIHFCDQPMLERLKHLSLLREFIENELEPVNQPGNQSPGQQARADAMPRLTNAELFRAYVQAYIDSHDRIRHDMTVLVRQLEPGPTGLPIEVYAFTNTTDWIAYEAIQGKIFDHLLAVIPEFDLRVFQEPSGTDFEALVKNI